jgi:glycosyltransferase involved in cell wall biosynthesis
VCDEQSENKDLEVETIYIGKKRKRSAELVKVLQKHQVHLSNSLIVTHGSWLFPTIYGAALQSAGFRWVYVPQGMLEPWSLQQGRLKKRIYFTFVEKPKALRANAVRAVSEPEEENLRKVFNGKVYRIENGSGTHQYMPKPDGQTIFVFMARLHHKKGVLPLVRAWENTMRNQPSKKLVVAGPDEGELGKLKPYLYGNVEYVGPVYGDDKVKLLTQAHYYVLPSFSEGFPSSVLEAMGMGAIPILTKGCNFPKVFQAKLGYEIEPNDKSIETMLVYLQEKPYDFGLSRRNHEFIAEHYSEEVIGEALFKLYRSVLGGQ